MGNDIVCKTVSISNIRMRRYGEEYMWTIQPYEFLVARHIVWLIIRKGTNWSLLRCTSLMNTVN